MTVVPPGAGLLLDTNVVVWLLLGERHPIPAGVRAALEDEGNELFVSAASVWEIAIKRSLGKLEVDGTWQKELRRLAFRPLPVTADHAGRVELLPWHHRDPFDRILVAQAQVEGYVLVTADARLPAYDVVTLWTSSP